MFIGLDTQSRNESVPKNTKINQATKNNNSVSQ